MSRATIPTRATGAEPWTCCRRFGARSGATSTLQTTRGDFTGLILPRCETADADHIVLKLRTGYNIGVRHDTVRGRSPSTAARKRTTRSPRRPSPTIPASRA